MPSFVGSCYFQFIGNTVVKVFLRDNWTDLPKIKKKTKE